ncbi:hypothetical protein Cni_G12552 [Canna indica]|uniref:DNA polymerase V n=1 Tax=Canna indica TaxID=4628 RepID=A0AAQ3K813_9LILI|nr:hypothetical protein Cni_G12552 [Canna indica]
MGSMKRPPSSQDPLDSEIEMVDEVNAQDNESGKDSHENTLASASSHSLKSMERRKKRKALDKERHLIEAEGQPKAKKPSEGVNLADTKSVPSLASADHPGLHVNLFRDLASADSLVREAAAKSLVVELCDLQKAYEMKKGEVDDDGAAQLEAEKDDGLENCSPSLRYAIRRLIRGVSSSRECARQGFALGLSAVMGTIPSIKLSSVMKLISDLLEVSSSMRGQEAKDYLLGRLFAYGSLARSGRIIRDWESNIDSLAIKDFTSHVISLAGKKRYLSEPAVSLILEMVEKLPSEALLTEVLKAPGIQEFFKRAAEVGDPDALYLALKMQERIQVDAEVFGKLLPHPFNAENFFNRDHLLYLANCFKESTFCLPRVHSLWPVMVNLLTSEMTAHAEDLVRATSSKKQKKNRKGSSAEDTSKNIQCFHEVVIEGSLLESSHDRKLLAFHILLLIIPKLPVSCIKVVLSNKLVHCLLDILSNKDSWLYSASHHFMKELVDLVGDDNDHLVSVITSLQKHSSGKFDSITKTQAVKELVAKFNTVPGCLLFVQNLMSLFVDEGAVRDEPSDQSQTTDENSDLCSLEDKEPPTSGNMDSLKNWVIDTMPRVLKNLKVNYDANSLPHTEIVEHIEAKFRVQTEITKFLAVQGLFSASLGTEITSFELQEKFKWPKAAISSSLCRMCIEKLQSLLEDAQRVESLNLSSGIEFNDLGSYFMCFLNTLYNIPSVSLYRTLTSEDEKAFKKLLAMESRLSQEERKNRPRLDANKLHAFRYLLIQLLLQVFAHPGEFSEAALELVICCNKAFPATAVNGGFSDDEEEDANDVPDLMDVLVETLLSLLPQSSGPLCFAVEQVFKSFCDDITDDGILQMLRVVKKDLKRPRRPLASSDEDEDDEDDFLGIEEAEEMNEIGTDDAVDSDGHADVSDGLHGSEASDEEVTKISGDSIDIDEVETNTELSKSNEEILSSDDSDDDMDDDAMFRMDSYLARIFKERKISGSDTAQSQLIPFKLRVLSLLEIYLQKNPGKPQVLMIYSYLARAYVNSHKAEGGEQLKQRIGGILQKKIFKAKDYPKGDNIQLPDLEVLLEKSLKLASLSRYKTVSSFAKNSTFWLLKIIQSRNFSKAELGSVVKIFRTILADCLSKKRFHGAGFIKDVVRRHQWLGLRLLGFLLKRCRRLKSNFRRLKTLDIIGCVINSCFTIRKEKEDQDVSSKSKKLNKFLGAFYDLIQELFSNMPQNKSRQTEVRRFVTRFLQTVSMLNLKTAFLNVLEPEAHARWESELGKAFHPFKMPG